MAAASASISNSTKAATLKAAVATTAIPANTNVLPASRCVRSHTSSLASVHGVRTPAPGPRPEQFDEERRDILEDRRVEGVDDLLAAPLATQIHGSPRHRSPRASATTSGPATPGEFESSCWSARGARHRAAQVWPPQQKARPDHGANVDRK